jgi:tripartite-type tricarboxylate transporter receptor subunit TctC
LPRIACAQSYPSRPIKLVVPFPPGGTTDIAARLVGQWLSERLGQPVIVENRPGAGGNIGTEAVVRAPADGYTLLLAGAYNTINAAMNARLSFDFGREIAPIAGIMRTYYVVEITPSIPVGSIPELVAYAKANPGKINMASSGIGSPHHVSGELFKMMTGVDMVHVPYRGAAPALTDLIGGQVQIMFDNMTSSLEHIRAGKLRPLAVTTKARAELLPDLPTVGELVPGYESSGWFGLAAPRGTSGEIVERLNKEVGAWLADPTIKARIVELGGATLASSSADLERLIADDTQKWAKVVAFAGIKPA